MFRFQINIYNSAGELVRALVPLTPVWNAQGNFSVLTSVFAPANGQLAYLQAFGTTYDWNGSNDNGQLVSDGVYNVVYKLIDADGNVVTQAAAIAVVSAPSQYALRIYNSAGEMVRQILVPRPSGSAAPWELVPQPDSALVTGSGASLSFNLGPASVAWNGTAGDGSQLTSGVYTVELVLITGASDQVLKSASVTLLRGKPSAVLGKVYAYPNPVGSGASGLLTVAMENPYGVEAAGRLYGISGELVASLDNGANKQAMVLDLGRHPLSGGVYIMVVTAKAPWGTVERRSIKVAILR
jgi:hypothetical protein